MKKLVSVLLSIIMLLSFMPTFVVGAANDNFCDGYYYTVSEGEATITYYSGDDTDVVIPATLDGYPVVSVGYYAFENNDILKTVTIGNNVTTIGEYAFANCDYLVLVNIGNSVESIESYAFRSCGDLNTVMLGENIRLIESFAFYSGLYDLTDVWYVGSKSDRDAIKIQSYNNYLTEATWHYYTCYENHTYDNDCDASCSRCSYTRKASHIYDHNCDASCNRCGDIRLEDGQPIDHIYEAATCTTPQTCTRCQSTIGEALGHIYSNECDAYCDRCYTYRDDFHDYSNATCTKPKNCKVCGEIVGYALGHTYDNSTCDKDCNVCGDIRVVSHVYTDDCDIDCNACGTRRKANHFFDNDCDEYCNVCDTYREVADHVYSHRCDRDCNVCYEIREVEHNYSNKCDDTCNYCGSKRTVSAHTYNATAVTKATLTKDGYSQKQCGDCGATYGNKTVIKKVGHLTLSTTTYTYDGKVKTPSVTVKDSNGKVLKKNTDYTVTYASGRKNVGTYKVTIKMKGKYSGTKTLTFKINPAKTKVSKLTAGKKSITVAITKKSTQVTGYQIQYSTSKKFTNAKTKTISSYKTTKYTLKSLSAKKTYYVRVRTYKTVNGAKYYSGWSTYKYVKTK